jgi:hypothetical protein
MYIYIYIYGCIESFSELEGGRRCYVLLSLLHFEKVHFTEKSVAGKEPTGYEFVLAVVRRSVRHHCGGTGTCSFTSMSHRDSVTA